jgi:type I restriction enzyme S subunit
MRRYDSYKDSGVEWLGKIPTDWSTPFIKNLVEIKITDGPHLTPNFIDEGGIPFLSVESIQNSKIDLSKRRGNISFEDHLEYSKKCKPQWNDILLVKSGSVGKLTIVDIEDEFNVWSPLSLIRIKKKGNPKYFYYFFHTDYFQTLLKLNSGINTQPNIGMGVIENLKVVSPPLSEQQQIVSYLDTKTSLIDSLIEKTQRKIELLKEKKTSLINEVVTKGLNPNVEMKDSGVGWIGEIPSHWILVSLKRLVNPERKITYGIVQPGQFDPNGRLMIRGQDYSKGWVDISNVFRVSDKIEVPYKRSRVETGDIVFTIVGVGVGNVGLVPEEFKGSNLTQTTGRISFKNSVNKLYGYFLMTSRIKEVQVEMGKRGSVIPGVNLGDLENYVFPYCQDIHEQQQIVSYLDEQIQLIDKTISVEERRIELLKEYRQSLISEVVTGKRKVLN